MLGNMKPVPRLILIVVVIAGVVYGIQKSGIMSGVSEPEAIVKSAPLTEVAPTVQPEPAIKHSKPETPSQTTTSGDAGLDALLSQGSKK